MADKYVNSTGLSRFLTKLKAYIATAISGISASNISAGVLAVAHGGTGASGIEETTVGIVTPQSGFTVTTSTCERWGKMVMLSFGIRTTNALSAGTDYQVATVSAAYRPKTFTGCHATGGVSASNRLYVDGSVMVRPIASIAAGSAFTLMATYLTD